MQQRRRGAPGRGSAGSRPRPPRRGLFWSDRLINQTLANNSAVGIALDNGVPEDEKKGLTATRLIIKYTGQAVTVNTSGLLHCGIYLVEDDAAAALAFAEVNDEGDDAGWMWRSMANVWASSNINDSSQFLQFREDLRAQRKYPGEDYTLMLLLTTDSATGSINVDGMVRTLYKRA